MICLGYDINQKNAEILKYLKINEIKKIYVFNPEKFTEHFSANAEYISYKNIIEYEYFYRLLQEIDKNSLIIINECLRTQNRNDLTYNCLRHYINQAGHILIFQYLPFISDIEDFMILFDFDTKSEWKRSKFDQSLIINSKIKINKIEINFHEDKVITSNTLKVKYELEKDNLLSNLGLKDPHTLPRNLYLFTGKPKLQKIRLPRFYIGRNNRFKLNNLITYKDEIIEKKYDIFEFPHNFIDFVDFLYLSKQKEFNVITTDIKIDEWYFNRYTEWVDSLNNFYNIL